MARHAVVAFAVGEISEEAQTAFSMNFGDFEDVRDGVPTLTENRLDARTDDVSNLSPMRK